MKAAELFVKALENEGVKYIFGVPGEENLDFLEALRTSSIRMIVTRHEQPAGFMAATMGRLTGKTGVCLSTLGPGATNFVTAAAYAQLGGMPMMMITGQKPILKSKQGKFQIVDVIGMMRPLTKFTKQVLAGHSIPCHVREAFRLAEQERPGAVHLELPEDIAHETVDAPLFDVTHPRRPLADTKSLLHAALMIQEAKRPLLLIGAGANRKSTSRALKEFVDKTGIYFFNTQMGKGVIDERHPQFLGTAALSSGDYVHCAIARADLIINVGHDVIEKPPFFMERGEAKVIHVNFFPADLDDVYFPTAEVVGDIAHSIFELSRRINQQEEWDFSYYARVKKEIDVFLKENSDDPRFPMIPQRIVADVRKVMHSDSIVALDNGMYKIWFSRNYGAHKSNTLLMDNALATMGAGLASAMAAALLYPEKQILAVCGDGGFMMNSQELETAHRLNLNLTIIVLNDNGFGMIKWKQAAMALPDFSLDYNNPDFVKYAESYGIRGHRVEKTEHFMALLTQCLQTPGIDLIDVPIDYSENDRVLNQQLREKTCLL